MSRQLIPGLLAIYQHYLTYRAANGSIPGSWEEVSEKLQLPDFIGDQLALLASRALATQREGLGAGADELWTSVPQGVQAGVDAGLQTVAEALIWTDTHPEVSTKDEEDGLVPTTATPPLELAAVTAQAVSGAAQQATALAAGWRYKTWVTQHDSRVRDQHRSLGGTKISLIEKFHTVDGDELDFPGDPAADIASRINCRCYLKTSR